MDDVGIAVEIVKAHIHHGDTEAPRKPRNLAWLFIDDTTFG
jgi:hypothetical protein